MLGDLTSARANYDSIRGRIVSDWKVVNGEFRLTLIIPANTTATVSLPMADPASEGGVTRRPDSKMGARVTRPSVTMKESGRPAAQARGVKFLRAEGGRSVFEVASGTYRFSGPLVR